jgi:hypothetical protein
MQAHSADLCKGLVEAGHEVEVITARHRDRLAKTEHLGATWHFCDATARKPGRPFRNREWLRVSADAFDACRLRGPSTSCTASPRARWASCAGEFIAKSRSRRSSTATTSGSFRRQSAVGFGILASGRACARPSTSSGSPRDTWFPPTSSASAPARRWCPRTSRWTELCAPFSSIARGCTSSRTGSPRTSSSHAPRGGSEEARTRDRADSPLCRAARPRQGLCHRDRGAGTGRQRRCPAPHPRKRAGAGLCSRRAREERASPAASTSSVRSRAPR